VLITVRARAPGPATSVELCGELPHWSAAIAMARAPGGDGFEARLRLDPGVYEVKARTADGAWFVDPTWRTAGDNAAIVVGGTDEPVLHAPAPPWLDRLADGRVLVRAALRHGAGAGLRLRTSDGVVTMRRRGADATHVHLELALAGAARDVEYAFVLDDGREVGPHAFRVALRDLPVAPPAWWRDAAVYTIFVDRFRPTETARWDRDTRCGGDLDGVRAGLPYLRDLGVTALHLTPITPSPSPHRYDATDARAVDPALGGEPALARLLDAAHALGLRVILDLAVTHVHRDSAEFRDVRAHGPASPYWHWFRAHRWPFFDGPDPGYAHYQHGQWEEPLLDLTQPEVAEHLVETFATWARRGCDGLRVDACADVPPELVARLRAAVRAVNPDAVVFGEVVPACAERWAPGALDAATDFARREAMITWLGGGPAAQLAEVCARQARRGLAGPRGLAFAGTHDQPRIATITRDPARARAGLLAALLGAPVPLLYYGDELGLASPPDAAARAFEDSWPDRQPLIWDGDLPTPRGLRPRPMGEAPGVPTPPGSLCSPIPADAETLRVVRAALALRRDRAVLRAGDEEVTALSDDVVRIRRRRGDDVIDVLLSRRAITPPPGARVLLATEGALVLDHAPPVEPALRAHNAELATATFREGHVVCPAYPTRLDLTVTEACNLRCDHCITDAPARTREGRARTLQPWLLDALDEAFAHADHVSFTHGGEALAAPIFPEVLRRIARHGRAQVHLATNGMLLDEERVRALIDLGVTSLMVSLDGLTAATNDRIRVLGRADRVLVHLEAAVALRARLGAELRIGVSTVVGRTNLAELPALARRCAALGVDWLKLEETYPATPFARRDLLDPRAAEVVAMAAEVRAAFPGVLVDHLAPPAACPCTGDPAAVAFRAADDFAHRCTILPCRAAWERCVIDADGSVHAVDHAQPVLGSLLHAPLLSLWNAAPALGLRARALATAAPACRAR